MDIHMLIYIYNFGMYIYICMYVCIFGFSRKTRGFDGL
jgi:hypothetical protein